LWVWNRVHSASWQLRSYMNGKLAAPGIENQDYGHGDPLHWPHDTLYPQKLALTSPTSGGSSVGIVRLRTKATEFSFRYPNQQGTICHFFDSWKEATRIWCMHPLTHPVITSEAFSFKVLHQQSRIRCEWRMGKIFQQNSSMRLLSSIICLASCCVCHYYVNMFVNHNNFILLMNNRWTEIVNKIS
jgi:hypothetical protein